MNRTGCLICGEELVYYNKVKKIKCQYCNKDYETLVTCKNNHYICDSCHSKLANDHIFQKCVKTDEKDPLKLANILLKDEKILMHGPEHHFLVPAVLLTTYYNTIGESDRKQVKLEQARKRAEKILGGFCGSHGVCGAAIGTGIFLSIITNATPLSEKEWKLSNEITAKILKKISAIGGPRCCKRTTFIAIIGAVKFVKENLGVDIKINKKSKCEFTELNNECIKEKCPFYPKK